MLYYPILLKGKHIKFIYEELGSVLNLYALRTNAHISKDGVILTKKRTM